MYFHETVAGVQKASEEAAKSIKDCGADLLLKEK
jgi:hypothetical protein